MYVVGLGVGILNLTLLIWKLCLVYKCLIHFWWWDMLIYANASFF